MTDVSNNMVEEDFQQQKKDVLIATIGSIGRYHILLFTVTGLAIILHSCQMYANKFLTIATPFACLPPPEHRHLDLEAWLNVSAPLLDDGEFDRCNVFDIDYSATEELERPQEDSLTVPCTSWIFDDSVYKNSAVQRWDLVCQRHLYPRIVQFLFFFGTMFGAFAAGIVGDVYGRLRAFQISLSIWVVATVTEAFVDNFWVWSLLRFVAGGASIAFNNCQTVYCIEFAGQKWRSVTNNIFRALPFALGYVILAGLVYLLHNLKYLELCIGLCGVPFLVALIFLPESPRWLLVNGRTRDGFKVVKKFCKFNRKVCTDNDLQQLETWSQTYRVDGKKESGNVFRIIKYPACLRNLLNISFCWFCISMGSFGLAYNIPNFGLDERLIFLIPGVLLIPITLILPKMENKLGRKVMLTFALLLSGVCLPLTAALPRDVFKYNWPILALSYTGQIGCSLAISISYSFSRELFPTSIRSSCLSVASASARLGSMLSPIVAISQDVNDVLPVTAYGIFCLVAAISSIWLWPETKNMSLPESLEECEKVASSDNAWLTCNKKNL